MRTGSSLLNWRGASTWTHTAPPGAAAPGIPIGNRCSGEPHGYRITSKKADLLMINTPAGIEGMFRAAGCDKTAPPLPEGFQPSPEQMAEAAAKFGNVILGPPR
ncbi:MAG TPA: hypothetical protein VGG75_22140 [Trebonia sp.]